MEMNLEKKVVEQWRMEKKFPFANNQLVHARVAILSNPILFSPLYPSRWVHNIYFDTINLKSYHENIDGHSKRIKTRLRWYQDINHSNTIPNLEFKIKENALGSKKIFTLNLEILPFFNPNLMITKEMLFAIKQIKDLHITGHYQPILHNYYLREYFISGDKKYRLTLDSQQKKKKLSPLLSPRSPIISDFSIIELKYELKEELDASRITQKVPFRMDKFSKYIEGIKLLNLL